MAAGEGRLRDVHRDAVLALGGYGEVVAVERVPLLVGLPLGGDGLLDDGLVEGRLPLLVVSLRSLGAQEVAGVVEDVVGLVVEEPRRPVIIINKV